jgi:hypothetical protein
MFRCACRGCWCSRLCGPKTRNTDLKPWTDVSVCLQRMLVQPAPLTVAGVFGTLHGIALEKGAGAAGRRQRAIGSLISCCRSGASLAKS